MSRVGMSEPNAETWIGQILDGSRPPDDLARADCPKGVVDHFTDEQWLDEGFTHLAVLNPAVDPERVRRLACSPDRRARVAAASAAAIPVDVADELARADDPAIPGSLAMNYCAPRDTLVWLLHHRLELRPILLGNPALPALLLATETDDEFHPGRKWAYLFARLRGEDTAPTQDQLRALGRGVAEANLGPLDSTETMQDWVDRITREAGTTFFEQLLS